MTLGWGQRSNIIKFWLPCQLQRILYQILCVFLQMKDTKHFRRDFYSVTWVMPKGWDFVALGVPKVSNSFFFKHGHCSISNRRGWRAEQNASNIFILCQTGDLRARSKGQIPLTCQFQRFLYQSLCVFSQIKDRNILNRIFILLPRSCPRVGLRGAGGVKNFSVGICDGAPSTVCSSYIIAINLHICDIHSF